MFRIKRTSDITWDLFVELDRVRTLVKLQCFEGEQALAAQHTNDDNDRNRYRENRTPYDYLLISVLGCVGVLFLGVCLILLQN